MSTKKEEVTKAQPMDLGQALVVEQLKQAAKAGLLTDLAIFHDIDIVRKGEKLLLPEGMSYEVAISELNKRREAEEKVVSIHAELPCFPLDGLLALRSAFIEVYGDSTFGGRPGFWFDQPPLSFEIPTAGGKMESIIWGKLSPSLWEGGYLVPQVNTEAVLSINGSVKRKFDRDVKRIIKRTAELIREASIYRGQSIKLSFSWQDEGRTFDPMKDSPVFWSVGHITPKDVILNEEAEFLLQSNIFLRIERQAACERNGVDLKAGALFMGAYGTGKTLCAKLIASKAVQHGWTFLYVEKAKWTTQALKVAEQYTPCIVFCEDIDSEASGERDEELNGLLNQLDGIDTKAKPIMCIFTSNHPEQISKAFLRAGRMSVVVPFNPPDAKAAARFVQLYSQDSNGLSLLDPKLDFAAVGAELVGFNSSFIAGIVSQAKSRAIWREDSEPPIITTEDIILSARASRAHAAMVDDKPAQTPQDRVLEGLSFVYAGLRGQVPFTPAPVALAPGNGQGK